VDFVDIDPRTYNLCPRELRQKLEAARPLGRLPKIVVPVHFSGQSCDMAAIHALSLEFGFKVVEDASHAIGARYRGEAIGSCRYSDITVFSFHPVKIITSAEGGMALTNDTQIAKKMELLRSHGMTRDPERMDGESHGPWYYQQVELGFNYRMTDMQAALGSSQLVRLNSYLERRHVLADRYDRLLAGLPVIRPWRDPDCYSSLHLYVVQLATELGSGPGRREVFHRMRAAGIGVNVHYIPVHTQPYYRKAGFGETRFATAESFYAGAITLPLYATLTDNEQDRVVDALAVALQT
jgi:dTDP-4-amino-4,6-dideoxygalactose transaminase